jgi:hypothetical protein
VPKPEAKTPLGNLPEEKGQSATTPKHIYSIGDGVFWVLPSSAGEWTFIGHPKCDKAGKILLLARSGEIGIEVDAG